MYSGRGANQGLLRKKYPNEGHHKQWSYNIVYPRSKSLIDSFFNVTGIVAPKYWAFWISNVNIKVMLLKVRFFWESHCKWEY